MDNKTPSLAALFLAENGRSPLLDAVLASPGRELGFAGLLADPALFEYCAGFEQQLKSTRCGPGFCAFRQSLPGGAKATWAAFSDGSLAKISELGLSLPAPEDLQAALSAPGARFMSGSWTGAPCSGSEIAKALAAFCPAFDFREHRPPCARRPPKPF